MWNWLCSDVGNGQSEGIVYVYGGLCVLCEVMMCVKILDMEIVLCMEIYVIVLIGSELGAVGSQFVPHRQLTLSHSKKPGRGCTSDLGRL